MKDTTINMAISVLNEEQHHFLCMHVCIISFLTTSKYHIHQKLSYATCIDMLRSYDQIRFCDITRTAIDLFDHEQ